MEMKVVNLKIKIKEVTEETRPLTIEEQCMYTLTHIEYIGDTPFKEFMSEVQKHLNEMGLIDVIPKPYANWGLFRTETIRDATPEEIMAYHCIKIHDECGLKVKECDTCIMNRWEYCTCGISKLFLNSTKILKNKEIILTLTEE